ncbi:hypothetical protein [Stenotrophomonas sp. 169]|uniref:hypothetical protein n=1 Tax=Stenotrophomonas sp. 169 TaxID=2770322 RepID=UPI001CB76AD0|nr:hypothetical protein [Stenotrophomonas sp. 169]
MSQREYGRSFGSLDIDTQTELLGLVAVVYVGQLESLGATDPSVRSDGGHPASQGADGNSAGGMLQAGKLISGVIESGGRGVEKAVNWMGEDTAMALAYVAMAAAGGPVKALGSMAWEASPAGQGIQQKKQDYLVNPLGEVVGRWGFGAKTDDQLQAVHPASNTMAGLGVDAVLSAVGVQAVRTGAKGVVEGSKGIGGKIYGAEAAVDGGVLGGAHRDTSKPANDGFDSHHCPAKNCYKAAPVSSDDGPAIKMSPQDHRRTRSHGGSHEAQAYRAEQQALLRDGKLMDAVQMDVDDIRSKFGNKYDDNIKQMLDYAKTLDPSQFKVGVKP